MSLQTLEKTGQDAEVKLMGFFENLVLQDESVDKPAPVLQTVKTRLKSETLAGSGPVNEELMAN